MRRRLAEATKAWRIRRTRGEIVFFLVFETCFAEVGAVFLEDVVFVGFFAGVFAAEVFVTGAVFWWSGACEVPCAVGLSVCV
jgi:hypothetical protein